MSATESGLSFRTILPDAPFSSRIEVFCSWCRKFLGVKTGNSGGLASSGICPECKARQFYPELMDRIMCANADEIRHIVLLELPNITHDEDRALLQQFAGQRLETLNQNKTQK